MLTLDHCTFQFSQTVRFAFDIRAETGTVTAITGKSGAGKTTLLNLIAGFYPLTSGEILFEGESLKNRNPAERHVGFLFQEHNLFPHLDLYHNIAIACSSRRRHHALIAKILTELELHEVSTHLPQALSGGQKQRTALARILLQARLGTCRILLLDEPFAALDKALRQKLTQNIADVTREFGLVTLWVSHHPEELHGVADMFLTLENGRICQK